MDIDDICDCLQDAVEYYRANADTYIADGWYNVSFRVRIDSKNKEARAMNVNIKPIVAANE